MSSQRIGNFRVVNRSGPPADVLAVQSDREEATSYVNRDGNTNDDRSLNSQERLQSDENVLKTRKKLFKCGTWNVRTLYQSGKLENCVSEMERLDIDILGLAEVRWTESGRKELEDHTFIFSGGQHHVNGVGMIFKKNVANAIQGYWPISDRVLLVKIAGKPFDIAIIQVYAPTSTHSDEELELFYDEVNEACRQVKSSDILIVMGDLNCKVGKGEQGTVVGKYGLGERSERGDVLVQFCEEKNLTLVNTQFMQHPRRLYTWSSPGDLYRNQIDYIMIRQRYKNCVKNAHTYPGADIFSDHNLLIMKLSIKLKIPRKCKATILRDVNMLTDENTYHAYNVAVSNYFSLLNVEPEDQRISIEKLDEEWKVIKGGICDAMEEILPRRERRKKKKWMTEEIMNMMEQRRKLDRRSLEYRDMEKAIKTKCKKAKEKWFEEHCAKIESDEKCHNMKSLHGNIKKLKDKKSGIQYGSSCIKDKNGDMLFEKEKVEARWVEYIKDLYDDPNRSEEGNPGRNDDILEITTTEVKAAIKKLKVNKATGPDNIPTECLKALDDANILHLTSLCNHIYKSGHIPDELVRSVFIRIPKKANAMECGEYRTISLMSHVMKVILRIILHRNENKIEKEIDASQTGFRPKMGTREGIFNLKIIIDNYLEVHKPVFICFIDYSKAFDRVYHEEIVNCLKKIYIDEADIQIIQTLYWNQEACIRFDDGVSQCFPIKRGVRQGCVLSPKLFNLYTQQIFSQIEDLPGCKIGGMNINNLRYADDTALIAENKEDLENLIRKVKEYSSKVGLEMNVKKTKVMVVSRDNVAPQVQMQIGSDSIEQVEKYVYLGHTISENGKCVEEIRKRMGIAKSNYLAMHDILSSRRLNIKLRVRMLRCYVISALLYATETWTICQETVTKLESLETWFYRKMLKISYLDRISNETVLKRVNESRSLLKEIKKRKLQYFGHLVRHNKHQRQLMEEKWRENASEGTRGESGRQQGGVGGRPGAYSAA